MIPFNKILLYHYYEDGPNRRSAGDVASLSPLIALASIRPALSTFDHQPVTGLERPRFQADTSLAMPTTSQYAMARETVVQNMIAAFPYGDPRRPGCSGVVDTSIQSSSLLKGSTARRRVFSVVSSRLLPHGMEAEKPNGPAGIGQ